MEIKHLKEMEIVEFINYFRLIEYCDQNILDGLREVGDIGDKMADYEMKSSFGSKLDEITINSQAHFRGCGDCLKEYRKQVFMNALSVTAVKMKMEKRKNKFDFFGELTRNISANDYLGIYYTARTF